MDIDNLIQTIHDLSIEHTNTNSTNILKKSGQYFTLSPSLLNALFQNTQHFLKKKQISILEPSYGTGRVILECMKNFGNNSKITGIEIDKGLHQKTKEKLENEIPNLNLINDDFLTHHFENKYDLIIGNPPYFEMKLTKEQKEEYQDIISGRANIYSLFLYKCINLLNKNGRLHFVLPRSILSSKYFTRLRHFIYKHCNILNIITFDNDSLFKKAKQNVIVLLLEKRSKSLDLVDLDNLDNNYTISINHRLVFTKYKEKIGYICNNTTSINNLNCYVKTGPTEWNKWKDNLTDNTSPDNTLPLIYSNNLNKDDLSSTRNQNRSRLHVNQNTKNMIEKGPFILVNRIISPQNPILRIYFERTNKEYFIENHVNIIRGDSVLSLEKIYKSLQNDKTIEFIKLFSSNTQISQDELENIIPIFDM